MDSQDCRLRPGACLPKSRISRIFASDLVLVSLESWTTRIHSYPLAIILFHFGQGPGSWLPRISASGLMLVPRIQGFPQGQGRAARSRIHIAIHYPLSFFLFWPRPGSWISWIFGSDLVLVSRKSWIPRIFGSDLVLVPGI